MSIINKLIRLYYTKRNKEIDFFKKNPIECTHNQFKNILSNCKNSEYGKERGLGNNSNYENFCNLIPIVRYEEFVPEIEKVINGNWQQLCPSKPNWYAKSSGTTNAESKFIPTTSESLKNIHFKGLSDVALIYTNLYPNGKALDGKTLTLGGSLSISSNAGGGQIGDLSGILISNTPKILNFRRFPHKDIALSSDFEEKIAKLTKISATQNITSFAGVPSWYMILMNNILDYSGKSNMCEIWPNISLFAHGGISFSPYKNEFHRLFPSSEMKYIETYNASEGFFAINDEHDRDDMLLMLDYDIYYEFLDISNLNSPEKVIPLEDVKEGKNYAMIISTSGGLYRYMIGDTVMFTSTNPYRIKITGRTKHFINIVGEELVVDNAEQAIKEACNITGVIVKDYTVAPIFMTSHEKAGHEWAIEFMVSPSSLEEFTTALDNHLLKLNSDYRAKRIGGALNNPKIIVANPGSFYNWMKSRGKLGGQHKIPRLSNTREYIDSLLKIISS